MLISNERKISLMGGNGGDPACVLRRLCIERRDHLSLNVHLSKRICERRFCCHESLDNNWDILVGWAVEHWNERSLCTLWCKLGFSPTVYHVWNWKERNAMQLLIKENISTEDQIVKAMRREVKASLEILLLSASFLQ